MKALSKALIVILLFGGIIGLYVDNTVQQGPENVVYISLDAVSAEHLECYGYHRETAPNICGMDNATVYENAYATSHWTPLSLASMETGVYPHRANVMGDRTPLDPDYYTIAELMKEEGYSTVLNSNHANMNKELGFDRGYDKTGLHLTNTDLIEAPENFRQDLEENLYFRMHLVASHDPYDPTGEHYNYTDYQFIEEVDKETSIFPRKHRSNFTDEEYSNVSDETRQKVVEHYDENIRAADNYVGKFIDELKEADQFEESLIIITADHGEAFDNYEEDVWLHMYANPPISKVPLIVKYPDSTEESRKSDLVSIMDPFKIIINELEITVDNEIDAIDPRKQDRDKHFTYTEELSIGLANGTHFSYRNNEKDYWRFYDVTDSRAELIAKSTKYFEQEITEFWDEVQSKDYQRSFNHSDREIIEEGLRDLGYIE